MFKKKKSFKLLTGVPPWIFIGSVAILLPIFTFITLMNVNRQKENNIRLLLEKGAALIKSFEAGTRTGMMGMHRTGFQLQRLLTETAQQTDIVYLLVADPNGTILAHNNPDAIDEKHGRELDLGRISQLKNVEWRIVTDPGGK